MNEIYKLLKDGESILVKRYSDRVKIVIANDLLRTETTITTECIEDSYIDMLQHEVAEMLEKIRNSEFTPAETASEE